MGTGGTRETEYFRQSLLIAILWDAGPLGEGVPKFVGGRATADFILRRFLLGGLLTSTQRRFQSPEVSIAHDATKVLFGR